MRAMCSGPSGPVRVKAPPGPGVERVQAKEPAREQGDRQEPLMLPGFRSRPAQAPEASTFGKFCAWASKWISYCGVVARGAGSEAAGTGSAQGISVRNASPWLAGIRGFKPNATCFRRLCARRVRRRLVRVVDLAVSFFSRPEGHSARSETEFAAPPISNFRS